MVTQFGSIDMVCDFATARTPLAYTEYTDDTQCTAADTEPEHNVTANVPTLCMAGSTATRITCAGPWPLIYTEATTVRTGCAADCTDESACASTITVPSYCDTNTGFKYFCSGSQPMLGQWEHTNCTGQLLDGPRFASGISSTCQASGASYTKITCSGFSLAVEDHEASSTGGGSSNNGGSSQAGSTASSTPALRGNGASGVRSAGLGVTAAAVALALLGLRH
jgi:hypothetical protein